MSSHTIASDEVWRYRAVVVRWKDGDTVVVDIDQGFGTWRREQPLRLAGVDVPELSTDEGKTARAWLEKLVPPGTEVLVRTVRQSVRVDREATSFERYVADVYLDSAAGVSLSRQLMLRGYGRPFNG